MDSLDQLPFDAQCEVLRDRLGRGEAAAELIARCVRLSDPSALAFLLRQLEEESRTEAVVAIQSALREGLDDAPDLYISTLFQDSASPTLAMFLRPAADALLRQLSMDRVSALAHLARWVSRQGGTLPSPDDREGDVRWLFADGTMLAERGNTPEIRGALRNALTHLAAAPKSISQTNAEHLLSRRVYADPGHFLFELLQNADDAKASRFRVRAEGRETLRVEHDGVPFSLRDIVGVVSIGQTTKGRDQIGFFGVGFKSVYEITERPRIHSGPFDIEIAHISIPRVIERPRAIDEKLTTLFLPIANGIDSPTRRLDEALRKTRAIPGETLMTLAHVRELCAGEGDAFVSLQRDDLGDGLEEVALLDADGTTRTFFAKRTNPPETTMVAIEVHEKRAIPLEGPTLFSFLPTGEETGFGHLVHSRFDVTVDRERLQLDSRRNDESLARAATLTLELAETLAMDDVDILRVLPTREAVSRKMAPFAQAFFSRGDQYRLFPKRGGAPIPAADCILVDPRAEVALSGLELQGRVVQAPGGERERQLLRDLGVPELRGEGLLDALREVLPARRPDWLTRDVLEALRDVPAARSVPLIALGTGELVTLEDARLGSSAQAQLFRACAAVLEERDLTRIPRAWAEEIRSRVLALADIRLLLLSLDPATLLAEENALRQLLDSLPDAALSELSDVPLFRVDSKLRSLEQGVSLLSNDLSGAFPSSLRDGSKLLLAEESWLGRETLARWLPTFDADSLAKVPDWWRPDAAAAATLLDAIAAKLSHQLIDHFSRLPLFLDRNGARRAIRGSEYGVLPVDEWLVELVPDAPWLQDNGSRFLRAARPLVADAGWLLTRFLEGMLTETQWARALPWFAQHVLSLDSEERKRLLVSRAFLARAEGDAETSGALRHLSDLHALSPRYARAVESGSQSLSPIDEDSFAVLAKLGDYGSLVCDAGSLLASLSESPEQLDVEDSLRRDALLALSEELPPARLNRLLELPLFQTENHGSLPVARWSRFRDEGLSLSEAKALAWHGGALREKLQLVDLPLLTAEEEAALAPLFERAQILAPHRTELASALREVALTTESARAFLDYFRASASTLSAGDRALLDELEIFASEREGEPLRRAQELFDPEAIRALPSSLEKGLRSVDVPIASELSAADIHLFGLSFASLASVGERLLRELPDNAKLVEIPARALGLSATGSSADRIEALGVWLSRLPVDLLEDAPTLDRTGTLRRDRLFDVPEAVEALLRSGKEDAALARFEENSFVHRDLVGALPDDLRARLFLQVRPFEVAEHLRLSFPRNERESAPLKAEETALFDWIRENGARLAQDPEALRSLGAAAIWPARSGPARAPSEMILDPSIPSLPGEEYAWSLAERVPVDVAAWLRAHFPFERKQRKALVETLLDRLKQAEEEHEPQLAAPLLSILARALDSEGEPTAFATRVKQTKAKTRIRVPVERGGNVIGWSKPKDALLVAPETARALEHVQGAALPPRVALRMDASIQRLIRATGGRDYLTKEDALSFAKTLTTQNAPKETRRVWSQLILKSLEAAEEPGELGDLPWLLSVSGKWISPEEASLFSAIHLAVFGADAVVEEELSTTITARNTPSKTVRSKPLTLNDLGRAPEIRATEEVVDWMETELRGLSKPKSKQALEKLRSLRDRLLLPDRNGVMRPATHLCLEGARELFGETRGELGVTLSGGIRKALSIPAKPDAEMILGFLRDESISPSLRGTQGERLMEALVELPLPSLDVDQRFPIRMYASAGEGDYRARAGSPITFGIASLDEPRLRLAEPPWLVDPMLRAGRYVLPLDVSEIGAETLVDALASSGVWDGWSELADGEVLAVQFSNPRASDLATALLVGMQNTSHLQGLSVTERIQDVEEALVVDELRVLSRAEWGDMEVEVEAFVDGGRLLLLEHVLDEPALLAPTLCPDPAERVRFKNALRSAFEAGALSKLVKPSAGKTPAATKRKGLGERLRSFFRRDESEAPPARPATRSKPTISETERRRDRGAFSESEAIESQLGNTEGFNERRGATPTYGFAISPRRLHLPWGYAPKTIRAEFDRRRQRFTGLLDQPARSTRKVGMVRLRGVLPAGRVALPVPALGLVERLQIDGEPVAIDSLDHRADAPFVELQHDAEVRAQIALLAVPSFEDEYEGAPLSALESFVPDSELPLEVHAFIEGVSDDLSALDRALLARDFVRKNYRYDPSYLEDPSVSRWLAGQTRGRANAHLAALHLGRDEEKLGAGVCYELNTLLCELLRRLEVPAAIASGWVFDHGEISDPDHLWCIGLFAGSDGGVVHFPLDASTTESGRPLTIRVRPRGGFRTPRGRGQAPDEWRRKKKAKSTKPTKRKRPGRKRRLPASELFRLLGHLERISGERLSDEERARFEQALSDPERAKALLDKLKS